LICTVVESSDAVHNISLADANKETASISLSREAAAITIEKCGQHDYLLYSQRGHIIYNDNCLKYKLGKGKHELFDNMFEFLSVLNKNGQYKHSTFKEKYSCCTLDLARARYIPPQHLPEAIRHPRHNRFEITVHGNGIRHSWR
jgi:hypothetical protein